MADQNQIEAFARAYHAEIRDCTTPQEREAIDAAIAAGTGNEHDWMDANDQGMAAWEKAFGRSVLPDDDSEPPQQDIATWNAGTFRAAKVGFSKEWPTAE